MRPLSILPIFLLSLTLIACSEAPRSAGDEPAAPAGSDTATAPASDDSPTPAAAADGATSDLAALPFAAALASGTPYAETRDAVLAAGWRPLITPACAENVGGEARICREWPELESCSGTGAGYCLMAFADPAGTQELKLRSAGGHADWSVRGDAATVRLDRAELEAVQPTDGRACPSADFATFLEAFAADPTVRAAWTAPFVRVALRYELGEDSVSVDGAMRAADFTGFPVVHQAEAFHFVTAGGAVDLAPLPLDIVEESDGVRRVSFSYGSSEGNSVRFVRADGCWLLSEDPEPPAS